MVHSQAGEGLRVGEACVVVVPPGGDADAGRVVRPFGLRALEDVFGEDLGDLVIRGVKAVLAERVGCFDGSD